MTQNTPKNWDIFCRVVDNYGDIGVCWRLAHQLAQDFSCHVRLWVDDLAALRKICPPVPDRPHTFFAGVEICFWHQNFPTDITPAQVVIEAFACEIPASYQATMKLSAPIWFNLEYLSAEKWVEDCHQLLSMHPQLGLKKCFFFPGFTKKTGGLLREKHLLDERDQFQASLQQQTDFLSKLGIPTQIANANNKIRISLFGYENSSIGSLLDAWIHGEQTIVCLVPPNRLLTSINEYLGTTLVEGDEFRRGRLQLHIIPFLSQSDYDRLLWLCDVNFVRGEDSFVRAQWSAKPFVWHIYPQEDEVHLEKLNAFLQRYTENANPALGYSITQLWQAWNQGNDCQIAWRDCLTNRQAWHVNSTYWCQHLNSLGDLASNMVQFCQKTL